MAITISINGLKKLERLADMYPGVAQKRVDAAIVRSIGEVDRNLIPVTPVKTAHLRNMMHGGISFSPFQGRIGTDLPYARPVHDLYSPGTPYKNPSKNKNAVAGFLSVAADASRETIQDAFDAALDGIVYDLAQI